MASAALAEPDTQHAGKEEQILDGAAQVFAQDGYEGASMSRIACVAGVSKGTVYNYFEGKAELFAAYVERDCSRWIVQVFEDVALTATPADTLRALGRRMARMMLSEPALVMYRMVIAEAGKFPELAANFFEAGPARAVDHLACYLRLATAQGSLKVENPEFAAEQFLALIQTKHALRRRLGLIDVPSQAQIDEIVECAVDLFMRGYGL